MSNSIGVEIVNNDLISFELDVDLFKKKYLSIYEQYKTELHYFNYSEIEEIIPNSDAIVSLIVKQASVALKLPNNKTKIIYNTDILSWYSYQNIDEFTIKSDSRFVYFILSPASGQAGSLGIWDTNKQEWIFNYDDEGFCVEAVIYSDKLDIFIGYFSWDIPMSIQHGEEFFVVDKNRNYIEEKVKKIFDSKSYTQNDSDYLDSFNKIDTSLKCNLVSNNNIFFVFDLRKKLMVIHDYVEDKTLSVFETPLL
jgi:hypothetical protein